MHLFRKTLSIALALGFRLCLPAQPALFSPAPVFDFGERRSGEVIEHTFTLENQGDQVLRIHRIRSSCGCTVPKIGKEILNPGETTEVTVRLDLAGRSGTQRQNITLSSNDPKQPAFTLSATGEALPSIRIEPRTLNFQQIEATARPEGRIFLQSTTGKPFDLKNVTSNNNRVELRVVAAADRMSAEIFVTPLPQKGEGHFTDVLIIETSEEDLASVRALVMWQISSGVSLSPAVLSLVMADPPQALTRFLMVRGNAKLEKPLEVTSAEWPGRDVEILISDVGNFGWRIELKNFVPQAEMNREEILLHTNAPGFETLRVPVRVLKP